MKTRKSKKVRDRQGGGCNNGKEKIIDDGI